MDPIIDSDWLGCKNEPVDDSQHVGNISKSWQWREMGINPPQSPSNKTVLENMAEDILVQKPLKIRCCDLPGYPRSTFLMVFSPDGTMVSSTHGNHNIYVSELASGKHVRILKGHPRTPWCIAFHPSHPQLIGSGCLGGQVRVWDLSGGSEVWTVTNETVIASIAFHPRDQLLVIATFNELYFWDWSQPAPFTKVSTNNINEKVRYVAFDALGYKLITGISVWSTSSSSSSLLQNTSPGNVPTTQNNTRRDSPADNSGNRNQENSGTAQEMIVNSYQNLVQRYDSLVRNYQRLFMARHQLTNTPPTNTTDRGTDPMETDTSLGAGSSIGAGSSHWSHWSPRGTRASASRASTENDSSRNLDGVDSGDGEGSSSRLLNLDVLSINSNPSRSADSRPSDDGSTTEDRSIFGSRSSAFQRLNDHSQRSRNSDPNERTARWLPNPFSSSSSVPSRSNTISFTANTTPLENNAGSSRTSVFTSQRLASPAARYFLQRRRNLSLSHLGAAAAAAATAAATAATSAATTASPGPPRADRATSTHRPTMTNSSTQISPVAAQTINESLDLIRDILRDSGTRLLNLITNMSLSTLASVERSIPRRGAGAGGGSTRGGAGHGSHSDDSEGARRPRPRPRVRLFSSSLRHELLTSESDSDSDHALQVDLIRSRYSSLLGADPDSEAAASVPPATSQAHLPTDRLVVELNINDNDDPQGAHSVENDFGPRFNITVSNNRFRVRSHSTDENNTRESNGTSTTNDGSQENPGNVEESRPSTSRDNYWLDDPFPAQADGVAAGEAEGSAGAAGGGAGAAEGGAGAAEGGADAAEGGAGTGSAISSGLAFRKVRAGVNALHRHTVLLADMWLRGTGTSMRVLCQMWESLRRRVLALQRLPARHRVSSYYTRPLMERCRFLSELARQNERSATASTRHSRGVQSAAHDANNEDTQQTQLSTDSTSSSIPTETEQSSTGAAGGAARARTDRLQRAYQLKSLYKLRSALSARRRMQASRVAAPRPTAPRVAAPRPRPRGRGLSRSFELHYTRNEIRMRAMQVLSIMFNMMMSCLEERGLSQLIIHMLRTLKKALALTCLMLMTNRLNRRENENQTSPQAEEPVDDNEGDPEPVAEERAENNDDEETREGVDVNPETSNTQEEVRNNANSDNDSHSTSSWPTSDSDAEPKEKIRKTKSDSKPAEVITEVQKPQPEKSSYQSRDMQKWSNRLAVQISAANRNTSNTARCRRDLYMESRRLKALHRTNPNVHPIVRRKALPPVTTSRIPSIRRVPPKRKSAKSSNVSPDEPVAGPSSDQPGPSRQEASRSLSISRSDSMNDFDNRINLFRIAHMQAVRLRTAARTRLRRLQTIRLYTPSSVREMFAIQSNNNESQSSNQSSLNNSPDVNRRPFAAYRPHFLTTRNDLGGGDGLRPFESILNNVAVPLVQVNDFAVSEVQGAQPQRMPRVHDYLQPIILAQNALVVEEGGPGGGGGGGGGGGVGLGGLLDAGLVSEAMPAPTHRVQAWDFTTGDTPDIADSSRNVVVQRCRIHNDASIDISKDGRLLVALLPVPRLRNTNHWLGVYSLEWGRLGQCLHTAVLEQSAVSVALSPTARHLAVGLGSRRFTTLPHTRNNVFALLYRLSPLESSSRTGLSPIKELEQNWEQGFTSLNCLRWAPQPGQGLVYANNTGQLIVMS